MNAPFLWIGLPILFSIILFFLRRWRAIVNFAGTILALLLGVFSLILPVNQVMKLSLVNFSLAGEWDILGRSLIINQEDLPFIAFLYLMAAVWFFLAWDLEGKSFFIPLGLGIISVLIAALAVRPFIYAALLIEVAVLGFVLMLTDSSKSVGDGTIRFLILQTFGMPFILLAGWFLASGEITPINQSQLLLSVVLLLLGFSFWIGLFPLHTWMPMIGEEGEPLVVGFIFSLLPLVVLFFLMDFLNSYAWLREYPLLFPVLRWLGSFMVLFAGLWVFFQKNLKNIFGYLAIAMNGLALLSLGVKGGSGIKLLMFFFLPRLISLFLFGMVLRNLMKYRLGLEIEKLKALAYQAPFTSIALIVAFFILSICPLLPGFPLFQGLISELLNLSIFSLVMFLLGIFLFMISGLKILSNLMKKPAENKEKIVETFKNKSLIAFASMLTLFIGTVPTLFSNLFYHLASKFNLLIK